MAIYHPARSRTAAFVTMALALHIASAWGADAPVAEAASADSTATENPKEPDCASLRKNPEVRATVTDAYRLTPEVRKAAASKDGVPPELRHRDIRLRDEVVIEIDNLDNLLLRRDCSPSGVKKPIVLYLDERPLLEVVAHPPVDPKSQSMIFPLKRTEKSRDVWTHLLGKPGLGPRMVAVSLGIDDEFAIHSDTYLELEVVPRGMATVLLLGFLVLAGAFLWLSRNTGLLRDTTSPVTENSQKPWSLSRVQAAWWFFIILLSYLFIGLITGDFSTTITGTTLVLLGIAAGTTLTSTIIDRSKDTPTQHAIDQAAKERVAQDIEDLQTPSTPVDQKTLERLAAKKSQLLKLQGRNEMFFKDILSDANGVSLHRFQIATWTFVLGGVFVCAVYRELAMPEFSDTLLGLMGLSAGTFVAMKNTEADTPKPDAPNPDSPP
jgi:hypothetical protein